MSWLESAFNYMNENNGAITASATIILVIITGRYVHLTKQMLKSTNTPIVQLFLHHSGNSITLCVQNIGIGFARDIKFTGDLSFKALNRIASDETPLEDLEPFKSGIDYLGPGHKIETFLFHRGHLKTIPNHTFDITATYKDLADAKYKKTFTFEIGNWDNTDQFGSPHTDEVANAIEKVAQQLMQANMQQGSEHRQQFASTRIKQFLNIEDPQITVLERIADALEKKASDE